jgi:putative colanic acid biosysnthesis UDP-glucose lipid carrier transferase
MFFDSVGDRSGLRTSLTANGESGRLPANLDGAWFKRFPGKRAFDIVIASTLLVLLFPLLAAIAVLIRATSHGPALFIQRRNGYAKRQFGMLKFRTMYVLEDGFNAIQCARQDKRVTRIGRWLRRMSLDELPQLVNIIKGEMSLVGPRPHPVVLDRQYAALISDYDNRFQTPPGITGLAQVLGFRGPTETVQDMEQRILADLTYVDKISLLLDLKILICTLPALVRSRNAC